MATETLNQSQLDSLAIRDLEEIGGEGAEGEESGSVDFGFCAICLEKIELQETALVKGCDHAYCVTCILRWASYKENPLCPQCKHPFESLSVHRSLDGCIHDYMFEESVCLLLRATWFIPLTFEPHEEPQDDIDDLYQYYYAEELEEDDEDLESYYMRGNSSTIRIGNRRWGDSGYVRAGRREARPVRQNLYIDDDDCDVGYPSLCTSSSSNSNSSRKKDKEKLEGEGSSSKDFTGGSSRKKNKEKKEGEASVSKELIGRRAKRAMKREAADRAAAAKHQQRLQRFGLVDAINDRTTVNQD